MKKRFTAALLSGLLLFSAGCSAAPAAPTDTPSSSVGPAVHTDWSALTPYQPVETVGGRWYAQRTETLIPQANYGTLVPYVGPSLSYTLSWDEDSTVYQRHLYGFATMDGKVVTDPVFQSIYTMSSFDYSSGTNVDLPIWQFIRLQEGKDGPELVAGYAALDGSWVTDAVYASPSEGIGLSGGSDGAFLYNRSTDRCVLLGTDGKEHLSLGRDTLGSDGEWWYYDLLSQLFANEGYACLQHRNNNYDSTGVTIYDLSTGDVLATPAITQAGTFHEGLLAAQDKATKLWGYLNTDGAWAIPPSFDEANAFLQGSAVASLNGCYRLIDHTGASLCEFGEGVFLYRDTDYIRVVDDERTLFWINADGSVIPESEADGSVDTAMSSEGRVFYYRTDDATVLHYRGQEYRLPQSDWLDGVLDETVILHQNGTEDGGSPTYLLVDLSGKELFRTEDYLCLFTDSLDPTRHAILLSRSDNSCAILSPSGEVLFNSEDWPQSFDGLFQVVDRFSTGLRDSDGNWILRLPRMDNMDD